MATPAAETVGAPAAEPPPPAAPCPRHRLKFFRAGGLDQVALETGADLLALESLDQKLWIALACPTQGLELDARTLELLDTDRDGRVRAPEVLAAIRFCAARLRDPGVVLYGADEVALAAIRDDTPEGRATLAAARRVLASAGRADALAIRAADVADTTKVFEASPLDGDGVVPPEAAEDLETRQAILDVIATFGGTADRGGRTGVDRGRVEAFFAEAAAYSEFRGRGETPEVLPLGERTAAAHAALAAVRAKVDDFFVRCRLAALDPRGAAALNRTDAELAALAATELGPASAELAAFPIARAEPGRALPLDGAVNPAWAAKVAALRDDAVAPLLGSGRTSLSAEEWQAVAARLAPYEAWLATKAGARVEPLGIGRVRALLAGGARASIEALVARDESYLAEALAVADVVRLVHYHRDLATLLRNFVSFADLYDRVRPAVFQAGTLFLDTRSCELCVRVDDPAAHAAMAARSRMYLAYCDCRRPDGGAMKIVACFTQGDAEYLMPGRHGVFYDRAGRDWDATVVRIVENPISLRQAFWAPYRKALRFVEDQIARFAAAKEKEADARLEAAAGAGGAAVAPRTLPAPVDVGKMVGVVAALGVGVGALGTLLGAFVAGFMDLRPWWAKLVAVAAVLLLVSGPSVLVAWLKLRQRSLGPILDANGWAVNGRVRINVPLGTALTDHAVLPAGARRVLRDPYVDRAGRRVRRLLWLLVVVAAAALAVARWLGQWPFGPRFW